MVGNDFCLTELAWLLYCQTLHLLLHIYLFIFWALGWRMVYWQHMMNMKILCTVLNGHQLTHGPLHLSVMMVG
jgi:hypothetical protein